MSGALSTVQREPWRLFFPLGVLMSWAGVSHWLFLWLGWSADPMSTFHALAQVEGFIWCFVLGFLFTMVPRRTQAAPPTRIDIGLGVSVPVLSVGLAKIGALAASQSIWLVGCVALLRFVVVRVLRGERRPPAAFVWMPLALGIGLLGAVATAVGVAVPELHDGHQLGKLLVTQGMVLGLLLGAGSIAIPVLTRGEGPGDAGDDAIPEVMGHVAAAVGLVATFIVEVFVDAPAGAALRAGLVALLWVSIAGLHRLPTLPGWNRWSIWLAAWAVSLGYVLMALVPMHPMLGLHVVFVGGFAPLALAVGLHVTLAHGGMKDRVASWSVGAITPLVLLACAVALRAVAELDPVRRLAWLAAAAVAFLLATAAWIVRTWPALRSR